MGDEYQLRKDIDELRRTVDKLDLSKLDVGGIATEEYVVDEVEKIIGRDVLARIGLDQLSSGKFNFATIKKEEVALDQSIITDEEFWILSNAYFDYDLNRFIKIDGEHTSFGIQIQANGTYPGEAQLNYTDNVGINIWRNPKKSDVEASFPNWRTDQVNDFYPFMEHNQIGLGLVADPTAWFEFGKFAGWSNSFMVDSYGGMTIGGAGFEVDGNGIFPFTRVSSSRYVDENNVTWYLLGILDNAYHPTIGGWDCDDNSTYSWFIGLRTPESSDLVKDNINASFVIMYNDTPYNASNIHELDPSNWHIVFEVNKNGMVI